MRNLLGVHQGLAMLGLVIGIAALVLAALALR